MTTQSGDDEAAIVAADLLGAFGVSAAAVRRAAGVDDATSVETAVRELLAAADSPAAALREAIVESSRGFDLPLQYRSREPYFLLSDCFDALDWSFAMTTDGVPVEEADEVTPPLRIGLEDASGVARDAEFAYPDSPIGEHNAPALVGAVNERLLYGLDCRLVLLSGWTDRWRFALVETDPLERLRGRFGDRVPVDGDPLLAPHDPADFLSDPPVPDRFVDGSSPSGGATTTGDLDALIEDAEESGDDESTASPGPVVDAGESSTDAGPIGGDPTTTADDTGVGEASGTTTAGPDVPGDTTKTTPAESDATGGDANDPTVVSGLDGIEADWTTTDDGGDGDDTDGDDGAVDVGSDPLDLGIGDGETTQTTLDSLPGDAGTDATDADVDPLGSSAGTDAGDVAGSSTGADAEAGTASTTETGSGSDEDGWRSVLDSDGSDARTTGPETGAGVDPDPLGILSDDEDGGTTPGEDDGTTPGEDDGTTPGEDEDATAVSDRTDTTATDGFELVGESTTVTSPSSASGTDSAPRSGSESMSGAADGSGGETGLSVGSSGLETTVTSSGSDVRDDSTGADGDEGGSDDRGFDGGLSGGSATTRVSNEEFGADVGEPDEDETYAAFGAAIEASASISVDGLLDDEEFVPEFPAEGPTEVRIEFEDEFDPSDPIDVEEQPSEDGFVWVNADGVGG